MNASRFARLFIGTAWAALTLPLNVTASASDIPFRHSELTSSAARPDVVERYMQLPLAFEPNRGQTSQQVKFLARGLGYGVFLTTRGAVLTVGEGLERTRVEIRTSGGSHTSDIEGLDELQGRSNYLRGSDPTHWQIGVPRYSRVRYGGVYPGIDLVYHGNRGQLEYDFVVAQGADPHLIAVRFEGVQGLRVSREGELVLITRAGEIRQVAPVAYQLTKGERRLIACRYVFKEKRTVGFAVGPYDRSKPLIIDPILRYFTLLSGTFQVPPGSKDPVPSDSAWAIAVDAAGSAYIAGFAASSDFPRGNPPQLGTAPGAFVLKVSPDGSTVVYSTFISSVEGIGNIAVDTTGNLLLIGAARPNYPSVDSPAFPIVNAFQPSFGGGGHDAFVAKLNATGSSLIYSSFLGGSQNDDAYDVALDQQGNVYVVGSTSSADFPITAGVLQSACSQCSAFLTKVSNTGALIYSTLLRGVQLNAVAVDSSGSALVTGTAYQQSGFPTTPGAFQPASGAQTCSRTDFCPNAFVTKVNPSATALVYSTYLGGSVSDQGNGIAVDAAGNAYVVGSTLSRDFPTTTGAFMPRSAKSSASGRDAFVSKLNSVGTQLAYSTFLAGTVDDGAVGVAVGPSGNAYVVGTTKSSDFPVLSAIQAAARNAVACVLTPGMATSIGLCSDGFITKLNTTGSGLVYSTYFGGSDVDSLVRVALDSTGDAYVVGGWWSSATQALPATGSFFLRKSVYAIVVAKISESGTTPAFAPSWITNGASFAPGLTFGGIATVFGSGITNATGIVTATSLPLPTVLAGTSVTANGVPLPLFAVANVNGQQQINFFAPFPSASETSWTMQVINNGVKSIPYAVSVNAAQPGVFTFDGTSGAVQHGTTYQPVTASNPASKGEVLVIYATGLGDVQPRPVAGNPASSSPPSVTVATPTVTIGGVNAEVQFSGLTPGFVGLYQVNARVPSSVPSGNLDVVVSVSGQASNTVKLAVQ